MRRELLLIVAMLPWLAGCGTVVVEQELPRPILLLSGVYAPNLVVEIDHMPGEPPSAVVVSELKEELMHLTTKKNVTVVVAAFGPGEDDGGDGIWTKAEVERLHRRTLDTTPPEGFNPEETATLHVLYLPGDSDQDAIGIAYDFAAAIFIQKIRTFSQAGLGDVLTAAERNVVLHEVGHSLGLVENGVPMVRPHAHPESKYHSSNPESIMYVGVERSISAPQELMALGGQWPEFDVDDRADLRAYIAFFEHPDQQRQWLGEPR